MRIRGAVVVVSLLVLTACGGAARAPSPSFEPVPGPKLSGEVVFQCGTDPNRLELFALAGGQLRRLTANSAVNTFSVHGDTIAMSREGGDVWGLHAELAPLGPVPLRGADLGYGQLVALRDASRLAFTRLGQHSSGLLWDVVYVKRVGSKARRVAEFRHLWQLVYRRGQLNAVVGEKRQYFLVRDVGTARERRSRLRTDNAVTVALSESGRAMYMDPRPGPREHVHVMSAGGRHVRTFVTDWAPKAWSRDERSVLVARGARLGVLDPATGEVRDAGRVACGDVYYAEWR